MSDKNVVKFTGGKVAAALRNLGGSNTDLSSGVRGGYAVLSIRGSRWHVKHNGEETTITDPQTHDPVGSLRLVLLKANPNVSKNYYKTGYVEGSNEPPTCFSVDGIRPDPASPEKQSNACASCQWNVFGSRITESGKKAKACSDSRRLAVVPENDLKNEALGGPMLLRVPAGSLSGLAQFGKRMEQQGFPYNTILTRVSFDHDVAHPKLEFNALRPLTDDEANQLVELLNDPEFAAKIETVLAKDLEVVDAPAESHVETNKPLFEEAPEVTSPQPAAAKTAAAKPAAAKPAAVQEAAPQPTKEVDLEAVGEEGGPMDDELKEILASLESMK